MRNPVPFHDPVGPWDIIRTVVNKSVLLSVLTSTFPVPFNDWSLEYLHIYQNFAATRDTVPSVINPCPLATCRVR